MKSTLFSSILSNFILLLLLTGAGRATACGPYYPIIPTPEFFATSLRLISDDDKQENLRLWQVQTSMRIPLRDIEEAIYTHSLDEVENNLGYYSDQKSENAFYSYINNTNDYETREFVLLAKEMEERWRDQRSPWYYPRTRNYYSEPPEFQDIIERCREYSGTRLRDRYGLQGVRALFASHAFEDCIAYYDSVFAPIADDNLLKRMARRYVGGCWSRLGDDRRADSIFAAGGDLLSLSVDDPLAYMAEHNPTAPQLLAYARSQATDSAHLAQFVPIAESLIADRRVKDKGDWEFLLAYFYKEYAGDAKRSDKILHSALKHTFADKELSDLARAYNMKSESYNLYSPKVLADLKWFESKCDLVSPDFNDWARRLKNIIYTNWVPRLWKQGDYGNSIMLCAYADAIDDFWGYVDYGSLSFQMMGSVTSGQLAGIYNHIMQDAPLQNFVRRKIRTDSNYYNELIGTLALREEKYSRAVTYLSKVSLDYQRSMNIYICQYLGRDPFSHYSSRWFISDGDYEYDEMACLHPAANQDNAKLNFARQMLRYKYEMNNAPTADGRGMARLMYAIGRFNSFEECWALTQYWRGEYVGRFIPNMDFYHDNFGETNYAFLYNYRETVGHKATEVAYETEVKAALATMQSPDVRARAEYILGNLATVVKRYPDTPTAMMVKTSCDNWESWL